MRVLFVAPYAPSRLRVRSYGFVRHLARRHDVNVLALGAGAYGQDAVLDIGELRREGIPVTVIQEPRVRPYLRTLQSALLPQSAPMPLQVAYAASPALRTAIASELRARSYDLLHVEHVRGLASLPLELPVPVVWDAVDCVSLLYEKGSHHAATPLLRFVGPLEARRLQAFERHQIKQRYQILVTSERDRQAMLKMAEMRGDATADTMAAEITVLPHGVDRRHFRPHSIDREPNTLIFSGKMDFHANVAGALMLAERVMPLIWRQRPATRLTIAGSNPPLAVRQLMRDSRITVTGYVHDLSLLMSAARVAVSCLPYAVGIQNKVLEAMASGTPVVASPSAAQGLEAVPGRDLLVADTPEELASAALRLLDDPEAWHSVADHGVTYVATHHDWNAIIERLTAVYERAREAVVAPVPAPAAYALSGCATRSELPYAGGIKARREQWWRAQTEENPIAIRVVAHNGSHSRQ